MKMRAQHILDEADTEAGDKDGKVSLKEFLRHKRDQYSAHDHIMKSKRDEDQIEKDTLRDTTAFELVDADADGMLSMEELKELSRDASQSWRGHVKHVQELVDLDKDGRISREELETAAGTAIAKGPGMEAHHWVTLHLLNHDDL